MTDVCYGLYSVASEMRSGSSVYESIDHPGKTVVVSHVVRTKEQADYLMETMKDGMEYRGRVGRFLRKEKYPAYKSHMRNIVYHKVYQ